MAYTNLLSADDILAVAVRMVEEGAADGISLRAVAGALGVKAPSLYRYFPNKAALELAVALEALRRMQAKLEPLAASSDSHGALLKVAHAYVRFAREHYALYSYVFQGGFPATYASSEGKAVWKTLLEAVSNVTGKPDDTASTVAIWSFLHGYATLEHAGGFGASGPKGGFELGLNAFLSNRSENKVSTPGERRRKH